MNSILSRVVDRLVLCPSTEPISTEHLAPETISTPFGNLEAWVCNSQASLEIDFTAIKIPGTGGRAERSSPHPFELWDAANVRTATINHHGYGNSDGPASLQKFTTTCDAVWDHYSKSGKPILVVGNSLGCISALYLAANYPVIGVFLRNPVPLQQMISTRPKYNWWNLWNARQLTKVIPNELDCVANSRLATAPLVLIQSQKDRVVPPPYQDMIYQAYSGAKHKFVIEGADHHHKVPQHQEDEYLAAVDWLEQAIQHG